MLRLLKWFKEESIRVLPAIIYFVIAFNLIHFTTSLSLREGDVRYLSYFSVTFAALIVGKVLILVNYLPFINAFPNRPLIYNIIWKFCIYCLFFLLVRLLHIFIHGYFNEGSADLAYQHVAQEFVSPVFWSGQMWLMLVFFVFIVFSELFSALGKEKVKHLLFG
ncbi:MAG: hypothetical protein P4M14_05310 [Gammaproteobacteria bacterium]|nr:hypothetical protein [Gammaproteobacteria bacterium]